MGKDIISHRISWGVFHYFEDIPSVFKRLRALLTMIQLRLCITDCIPCFALIVKMTEEEERLERKKAKKEKKEKRKREQNLNFVHDVDFEQLASTAEVIEH